jgi:hypothetical protein
MESIVTLVTCNFNGGHEDKKDKLMNVQNGKRTSSCEFCCCSSHHDEFTEKIVPQKNQIENLKCSILIMPSL